MKNLELLISGITLVLVVGLFIGVSETKRNEKIYTKLADRYSQLLKLRSTDKLLEMLQVEEDYDIRDLILQELTRRNKIIEHQNI